MDKKNIIITVILVVIAIVVTFFVTKIILESSENEVLSSHVVVTEYSNGTTTRDVYVFDENNICISDIRTVTTTEEAYATIDKKAIINREAENNSSVTFDDTNFTITYLIVPDISQTKDEIIEQANSIVSNNTVNVEVY